MSQIGTKTLNLLWQDRELRERHLREVVSDALAAKPPPVMDDHVVASYFFAFRSQSLKEAVGEISYHATIGVKNPPAGSLLAACAAKPAGVHPFDRTNRLGLVHVAFPL